MNKIYQLAMGLAIATASLTSCSRSTYSFNTAAPAYLGAQPVKSVAKAKVTPVAVARVAEAVTPESTTQAAAPVAKAASVASALATPTSTKEVSALPAKTTTTDADKVAASTKEAALATAVAPAAKPSLFQRLVVHKMAKQVARFQQKRAETGVSHIASKAGRAALIALAGLVLYLIIVAAANGGVYSSGSAVILGILATIGLVTFIVGVVLLIIALINGN